MIEMFRAIGFDVPDELSYNQLAETAEVLGDETRIDRRGTTLHGRCWRLGEGLEIWTVLRESAEGTFYVDCRPAFRPRYAHGLGPWELIEYDEDGEAVVEGQLGRGASSVSFELQNLTELRTETFLSPKLTVSLAGLAYSVRPVGQGAQEGLRASDREGAAPPPDGNDYFVTGTVEKRVPIVNPCTGVELAWLLLNAGGTRLEIVTSVSSTEADAVAPGATVEAEVWLQGYVLTDEAIRARYEGVDPEWRVEEAWSLLRRGN